MQLKGKVSIQLFIVLAITILLSACGKEMNLDKWQPDMLLPIVKGKASMEDLSDIKNKTFVQNIPSVDLGIPAQTSVAVTNINLGYVGPYSYEISNYFEYVTVDSCEFGIDFKNVFPVDIKQGTRIDFRSAPDTSNPNNIVFSHTISHDIVSNGSYNFKAIVTNTTVPSKLYMYLQNFRAQNPAGGNLVFATTPGTITFEINFLSVNKVAVHGGKEFSVADTTAIEFGDDSTTVNNYDSETAEGTLKLFITNRIPVNSGFQIYFYDANMGAPVDSFYQTEMVLPASPTDVNGDPVNVAEQKFELPLTARRITKLKSARYMSYRIGVNTFHKDAGTTIYASRNCNFEVQITGDLKLKVASFLKFK